MAFPFNPIVCRAGKRVKQAQRFPVVTLQSGQGARSLSLRLKQDPVPLRGPWALAFAPLQAPSLTASPRFPAKKALRPPLGWNAFVLPFLDSV